MNQQTDLQAEHPPTNGVSARRRFLGMGAKALPVVVTVASQPALGVTCFTPSRSLSRNTSLSQKDFYGDCKNAESPGNYMARQTKGDGGYHWPFEPGSKTFHSVFPKGSVKNSTLFVISETIGGRTSVRDMTFGEAITAANGAKDGNVAFHIIAAYLNILGAGTKGAVISPKAMDLTRLLKIWGEYKTKGTYLPMAGVTPEWNGDAIVLYLKSNGIVA